MGYTVGIDLGTTNSAIAAKKIQVTLGRNSEGDFLTPSWVCAVPPGSGDQEYVVGKAAKDLSKQYPRDTVFSIKRFIGRSLFEPAAQRALNTKAYPYAIHAAPDDPERLLVTLRDKTLTPEDLSALILKKIVGDAELDLNGKVDQAIITVPAYFSDRQKHATRIACEQAGLKVLRLLAEPTAAAISFGLDHIGPEDSKTVMVFDLGGGTFDISILSIVGGTFMEVTKGGDMWLGGDDIDQTLMSYVLSKTEKTLKADLPEGGLRALIDQLDPVAQARFRTVFKEACEQAKIELSSQEEAYIEVLGYLKDKKDQWIDIDVNITRTEFSELLGPTIARIEQITSQVLTDIHFEPELIDEVIMVGGSSMIPAIQDAIKKQFGSEKVRIHPRPMFAIVEGAAILAHRLAGAENAECQTADGGVQLMGGTAHDYFLQLADGKRLLLAKRNSPLPLKIEQQLVFKEPSQLVARLRVLNEVDHVLETVGEFWYFRDHNPERHKLTLHNKPLEITLGFEIDEDNVIRLQAWPTLDSQKVQEVLISRDFGATRYFNELEKVVSQIAASTPENDTTGFIAVHLSNYIVKTILGLSGSQAQIPGDRRALEEKIYKQIGTLEEIGTQLKEVFSNYKELKLIDTFGVFGLTDSEKDIHSNLIGLWDEAWTNFTNPDALLRLSDMTKKFVESLPDQFVNMVWFNASIINHYPKDSKTVRESIKKYGEYRRADRLDDAEVALDEAREVSTKFSSVENTVVGGNRFDRDVAAL